MKVLFKRKFNLSEFCDYADGKKEQYQDTQTAQALDILISHGVSQRNSSEAKEDRVFQIGDNIFFPRSDGDDLGKWGMIALRGFSSHVKAANGGQILLNVNTAFSAFYKQQLVSDYLKNMTLDEARNHLVGKRVEITYNRCKAGEEDGSMDTIERRTKTITAISGKFANAIKFEDRLKSEVSVWDHFTNTYPNDVGNSHPEQYCINTGSTNVKSQACWFLPDKLRVIEGQIYRKTLDPDMTAKMIKFASHPPADNQSAIQKYGLRTLGLQQGQQEPAALRGSGITVEPNMMKIPFRLNDQPAIQYGKSQSVRSLKPASWSTMGRKFINVQNWLSNGIAFIHSGDNRPVKAEKYIEAFQETIFENGIQGERKQIGWKGPQKNLTDVLRSCKPSLVVLVLEGKLRQTRIPYAAFRSDLDQIYGKPSLVLNAERMDGQGDNLVPYVANNAMKVNIRLGNENHSVRGGFTLLSKKNGKCDTLVLGADLIHPKQSSAECTPSIAALVGSVDGTYATFLGSARHQKKGNEYVDRQNMLSMARERIKAWTKKNKIVPTRILYYRDGTDNTQYEDVRKFEISAIKQAWEEEAKKKSTHLEMTTVVVIKRHATRFYPEAVQNQTDTRNCMPGTVVDRGVTSPYYFDFYLQSHDVPKRGTSAKPTHYFVLENGMGIGEQDLQHVTNSFCYNYAHSTNAVSYASPAYYADRLCERASLYLRRFYDGDPDLLELNDDIQEREMKADWGRGGQGGNGPSISTRRCSGCEPLSRHINQPPEHRQPSRRHSSPYRHITTLHLRPLLAQTSHAGCHFCILLRSVLLSSTTMLLFCVGVPGHAGCLSAFDTWRTRSHWLPFSLGMRDEMRKKYGKWEWVWYFSTQSEWFLRTSSFLTLASCQ